MSGGKKMISFLGRALFDGFMIYVVYCVMLAFMSIVAG